MEDELRPGMVIVAVVVLLGVMYLTWLYFARSSPGDRPLPPSSSTGVNSPIGSPR